GGDRGHGGPSATGEDRRGIRPRPRAGEDRERGTGRGSRPGGAPGVRAAQHLGPALRDPRGRDPLGGRAPGRARRGGRRVNPAARRIGASERPGIDVRGAPGVADARVRVLHVLATLLPGGSEISVLRLIAALDRTRYHLRVAFLRGEPVLAGEFRAAGIEVVPFGMRRRLDPACLPRLRRYV